MSSETNFPKRDLTFLQRLVEAPRSILFALSMLLILFWQFYPQVARAQTQPVAPKPLLCRFGFNLAHSGQQIDLQTNDMQSLRSGWYIDYLANSMARRPSQMEHAPTIRLRSNGANGYSYSPNGADLQAAIAANPGADWFIGNEPDRRIYQDDMPPALYARAYHDLYKLIKTADAKAQIWAGSIVQPTPLRLLYLDQVLQNYATQYNEAMPVDGWAIHNFILNEASCAYFKDVNICWGADIPPGIDANEGLRVEVEDNDNFTLFVQQIQRFREWMAARGYMNKPLYVSEYGVLMPEDYGFPPSRVNLFMNKSFDYMFNTIDTRIGYPADNYRLVQRFSWYSLNDQANFNGYLFERSSSTSPYRLSAMGQNYISYTHSLSDTIDLLPVSVDFDPPAPATGNDPITLTVRVKIANSGNLVAPTTANVRFFDGDPQNGGIEIGSAQQVGLSGCGETATLQTQLANLIPKGDRTIYVQVDPENVISETSETNNLLSQKILFASQRTFLPLLRR